jgi:hypothetical protein
MNWYKKIKLAAVKYLYHGSSMNNLSSILSEGLNNYHGSVYDETFQNTRGERSVESYGGVYFTDSLRTAAMAGFTASEKNKIDTQKTVIVIAQLEDTTPSILIDEDILPTPTFALMECGANPQFPISLTEWIINNFPNIENGVNHYLESLSTSRIKVNDVNFLQGIKPYVYDLLKTFAIQKLVVMLNNEDWGTGSLKDRYPELSNLPDMGTAIQNYRNAFSLFMQKAHRITSAQDDMYENNVRVTEPISFRGKNKIVLISTFNREPRDAEYSYTIEIIYLSDNNVLDQYVSDIQNVYSNNILVTYQNNIVHDQKKEMVGELV